MPNFKDETGIEDEPWERIRKVMCTVNDQRHIIREAESRLSTAMLELYHILWPRTDSSRDCSQCGARSDQYCTHKR